MSSLQASHAYMVQLPGVGRLAILCVAAGTSGFALEGLWRFLAAESGTQPALIGALTVAACVFGVSTLWSP